MRTKAHGRTSLKRKTPLRRVSKKRARELPIYLHLRKAFLLRNPSCEFHGCFEKSKDVHHVHGRRGKNYLDEWTWMSVCRYHHNWIHSHPKEAREHGYLL